MTTTPTFTDLAVELRLMAREEAGGAEKCEEFILFAEEKDGQIWPGMRAQLCDMRKRCRYLKDLHDLLMALAPQEARVRNMREGETVNG